SGCLLERPARTSKLAQATKARSSERVHGTPSSPASLKQPKKGNRCEESPGRGAIFQRFNWGFSGCTYTRLRSACARAPQLPVDEGQTASRIFHAAGENPHG